jgi:hypothetical protein
MQCVGVVGAAVTTAVAAAAATPVQGSAAAAPVHGDCAPHQSPLVLSTALPSRALDRLAVPVNLSIAALEMAAELGWSKAQRGSLLGSFFYGYLTTQVRCFWGPWTGFITAPRTCLTSCQTGAWCGLRQCYHCSVQGSRC